MFKLHPLYFLLSFAVGMLYCYLTNPKPEVIVKFPSPFNAGKVVYKDDDTCYKYKADKVECPIDKSKIKPQPLQEDDVKTIK
jgi:hypothetical protein